MYTELYQYLVQHKELPVPGIGTFLLQRKPATADFPGKKINPPSYAVLLQPGGRLPGQHFFNWLADKWNIPAREAVFRFNDFVLATIKQVGEGAVINWDGVGKLNRGLSGDVKFTPLLPELIFERPVTAEKIIRPKAEHMVRVGEDQRTSAEMTEMFSQEGKKSYWWAWALGLILLAIMFLGWYFSEYGLAGSATANRAKLIPGEGPAATYKMVP